jgi:hypothetical protein
VRTIGVEERRARLGRRHLLAAPAEGVERVATDLVGLHSSDPTTIYLSAWARTCDFGAADLEDALYERRSLVRMLGMRRTLFVVPVHTAGVMNAACTRALVAGERRRLIGMLEGQGVASDGARWLARVSDATLEAIAARGQASAAELAKDVPELGAKLAFGQGKSWATTVGVSTRVLFLLATQGRIVRARPLGTWVSSQYRWARTEDWLGDDLPDIDPAAARAELLAAWLRAFGPGTLTDIRWWTGWTVRDARNALSEVEAVGVALDEGTGYVLPDDLGAPRGRVASWVALLPGLDPTVMGWKERGWYLGDHAHALFDRNGNAGPTVWVDGQIVGGWSQTPGGEVVVKLLEPVRRTAETAIAREARRLTDWLDHVRVTPRFRTPLEKALHAGEVS